MENTQITFPINLPEGVTNLSERTEATVKVRFVNLAIKEFDVTDITIINVPEGMEAELMSQVLKVRLRGPAAVMNKLTTDNIKVIFDFSGKETGSFTIKPTIVVSGEAFMNVGAVGSYSVSTTLRPAPTEEPEVD